MWVWMCIKAQRLSSVVQIAQFFVYFPVYLSINVRLAHSIVLRSERAVFCFSLLLLFFGVDAYAIGSVLYSPMSVWISYPNNIYTFHVLQFSLSELWAVICLLRKTAIQRAVCILCACEQLCTVQPSFSFVSICMPYSPRNKQINQRSRPNDWIKGEWRQNREQNERP